MKLSLGESATCEEVIAWIQEKEYDKALADQERAAGNRRMVGFVFQGKNYDPYFEWSDDRIYCSELVWKIFKRALGVEIGATQVLGDFDLSDPVVKQKIQERWKGAPPKEEIVISPGAMFDSDKIVTVYSR